MKCKVAKFALLQLLIRDDNLSIGRTHKAPAVQVWAWPLQQVAAPSLVLEPAAQSLVGDASVEPAPVVCAQLKDEEA